MYFCEFVRKLSSSDEITTAKGLPFAVVLLVKRIGVPDARFHDLRHTYAYMALSSNIDVKTVQHNLGHSTTDFTLKVYAHVTTQMQEKGAENMEQYIQGIGNNHMQ